MEITVQFPLVLLLADPSDHAADAEVPQVDGVLRLRFHHAVHA